MKSRRRYYQPNLAGIGDTERITSRQAASTVVGHFFEHLTASMVNGYRLVVEGDEGENPDVVDAAGEVYESKASLGSRWLLAAEQCHTLEATPRARYVLWRYERYVGGLAALGTVEALRRWLARGVLQCLVLPAAFPREILTAGGDPGPHYSNETWGTNYWLRHSLVRRFLAGALDTPTPWTKRTARMPGRRILNAYVRAFDVQWVSERADNGVTARDRDLAAAALGELDAMRHEVVLVANDDPRRNRGQKIRVVTSSNPEWYSVFVSRRPKKTQPRRKKPQTQMGFRRLVRRALERIRDDDPRPWRNWSGWELLELLHEQDARERWSA